MSTIIALPLRRYHCLFLNQAGRAVLARQIYCRTLNDAVAFARRCVAAGLCAFEVRQSGLKLAVGRLRDG